jgi:hypothetical protein
MGLSCLRMSAILPNTAFLNRFARNIIIEAPIVHAPIVEIWFNIMNFAPQAHQSNA